MPPARVEAFHGLLRRLPDEPAEPRVTWLGGAAGVAVFPVVPIQVPGLPGRLMVSRLPGRDPELLGAELDAVARAGVDRVFALVPGQDLETHRKGYLGEARRRFGDRYGLVEVLDHQVPPSDRDFELAIARAWAALEDGQRVLAHCWAGCGRTGMFAACLLVRAGLGPREAVRSYRLARCCGPENLRQLAYVFRYAERQTWPG